MSHLRRGQGFHRLSEIPTHRPGQRVFETYRCKPFELIAMIIAARWSFDGSMYLE